MKFRQLIEYIKKNIFLQKYAENEAGILVDLFLFYKKTYEVKVSVLQLSFNIF